MVATSTRRLYVYVYVDATPWWCGIRYNAEGSAIMGGDMRLGIADHLGWAVAVTASDDHEVVDRRRIELIEPDVPAMPFEHDTKGLDDVAAAALIEEVRASVVRATSASLDALAAEV